ncbi:unnamed protein product [Aureobasidium mustum]|uniref:IBR domain-containing protein n=1 Tax=Aureobasidium mustum TaxID=2773714 RepID=A0A9N8JZQ0_9PEZI|nr:unnamed protein product [Aureobasidium mustum]
MSNTQFNAAFEASGMPTSTTVAGDCPICCEEGKQPSPVLSCLRSRDFLQVLKSLIPAGLYERMYNNFYVVWATAGAERLWCADTDWAMFIPPSHESSLRGGRQCFCGKFACLTCKKLAHDGACTEDQELQDAIDTAKANGDSHADAERVQQEIDEEQEAQLEARFGHRDAEANELFERAGRPLARQVLAGAHVFLIMLREYMARLSETDVDDICAILSATLEGIHDIDAPSLHIGRQLSNQEFEPVNMPFGFVYNISQDVIGNLFNNHFRSFRSQEFLDYELEATRLLFVLYGENESDDNELREEIRERLARFGTT